MSKNKQNRSVMITRALQAFDEKSKIRTDFLAEDKHIIISRPKWKDTNSWKKLPQRSRQAFWSMCLKSLGGQIMPACKYTYLTKEDETPNSSWLFLFGNSPEVLGEESLSFENSAIFPLITTGLLGIHKDNPGCLYLTPKGRRTWLNWHEMAWEIGRSVLLMG